MKYRTLLIHLFLALLVAFFFYALFAVFTADLPHPEPISPYAYALAAAAGLFGVFRARKAGRKGWAWYLLIPALSVFGALEEISYGAELGWFKPFEVGSPDLIFQDFHNFSHMVLRWVEAQTKLPRWQPEVYRAFLRANAFTVAFCLIWWLGLKNRAEKLALKRWKKRLGRWFVWGSVVLAAVSIVLLLSLPRDPKNILFFGLSAMRLTATVFLLAAAGFWLWIQRRKSVDSWFSKLSGKSNGLTIGLGLILLALLLVQFRVSFSGTTEILVRLERIVPLAMWVATQIALTLLAMALWRGHLRRSVFAYADKLARMLAAHPTIVYVSFALVFLLISQALDRDYFFLPTIISADNPVWVRDWHVFTEEAFEFIAAIYLGIAGLVIFQET